MRTLIVLLLLCASMAFAASPPTGTVSMKATPKPPSPILAAEIERYFPAGTIAADVCEIGASPRYTALLERVQAAIQKDPEWWKGLIAKAAGGQIVYDPKMGITHAEYDEMIALTKSVKLKKVASTTLRFARTPSGSIRVTGGKGAEPLSGLTVAADRQTVSGGFGAMAGRHDVYQTDPSAPSGLWSGVEWQLETGDPNSGNARAARLAVGRISASSRGILYLDVREMKAGKMGGVSRILTYPLATQ